MRGIRAYHTSVFTTLADFGPQEFRDFLRSNFHRDITAEIAQGGTGRLAADRWHLPQHI